MASTDLPPGSLRERMKAQTRELIVDQLVAALAEGALDQTSHDAIAKRIGVSRQTVYRYFPDRDALMAALWERINTELSGGGAPGLPTTEQTLLDVLAPLFTNYDRLAPLITITQSTPQGRAMRLSVKERRSQAFLDATADATAGLGAEDRKLVAAILQLLIGGQAWLEMRQQWDLTGEQMARACGWAARTLLADLHARRGRPLDRD
jgi:AcrR family transcriptional regulator